MNRTKIKKILGTLTVEIDAIADVRIANIQKTLLNLVEYLLEENTVLKEENQKLKDEINRLKSEQGKPNIRKQKDNGLDDSNHSSEADRNKRANKKPPKKKSKKKNTIKIDRHITCDIDKGNLPDDVVFKGYETRVIQDIKIITDNIEFKLPVYYSPSLKKTFLGELPPGYHGEFGPGIRATIITLYRDSGMTEPAIERFFRTFNIQISKSTISRMITEGHEVFHQEKEDIIDAGLKSGLYQHIDDTGCKVNGKNHYTHILCNPCFTAFFTRPKKDRLTLVDILCRGKLKFEFSERSYELMIELGLSEKQRTALKNIVVKSCITRSEIDALLKQLFPNPKKHRTSRRIILEASALIYYQGSEYAIEYLMCDDAPQFNRLAKHHALCWIHEGRHYKKLNPIVAVHRQSLDVFVGKFWDYYHNLLEYKLNHSDEQALLLSAEFDVLFSMVTGYEALDERIAKTLAKKESLMLVLTFPFLPLHNNSAELGARVQARMRDINLQTISDNGTKTKDTFATIVQTAKKLGVNIYNYIYDRISETFSMPSLANLIFDESTARPVQL